MKRIVDIGDLASLADTVPLVGSVPLTFAFDPDAAKAALSRMASAPPDTTRVTIDGTDWAQAAMAALLQAELLAADAGVVPYVTLPTGERGVLTIGAAREHMDKAPEDVRTIYLATHAIVRSTHAGAFPVMKPDAFEGMAGEEEIGAIPVVVLVVLGLAAIIATATYFIHHDSIEVEGKNLRATAAVNAISTLAREQLAKTGEIDSAVWESLRSIANLEGGFPWLLTLGGVAVVAGGGYFAWRHFRNKKAIRRAS